MAHARTGDDGMTLPELLVVMAIVAILAAVAIPIFLNQQAKAYDSSVQSDLANVAIAVRAEVDEGGALPEIEAAGDGFTLNGKRLATSPGTVLSEIQGDADDYCFSATHPRGKAAAGDGYRYTVMGGIEEGGCP